MPNFTSVQSLEKAVQLFNKHAYNAGMEFKVYTSESNCLYIQASFDFGYYINVDIEFRDVIYTNLNERDSWPDAWYEDQIFILNKEEMDAIIEINNIEINNDAFYFGIVFNITGKENYFNKGTVIFSSLYINWRNPDKNKEYQF